MRKKIGENQKDKGKRLSVTKEDSDSDSTNSSSTSISSGVTRLSIGSSDSDEDLLESKENSLNEVKKNKEYIKTLAAQLLDGSEIKISTKASRITIDEEYAFKNKKEDKENGVSPGFMLFNVEPTDYEEAVGMVKLPKNQLWRAYRSAAYDTLGELLAIGIADIWGFSRAKCSLKFVSVDGQKAKPSIFSKFNLNLKKFVLAGNNPKFNDSRLQPLGEGLVAVDDDLIEDFGKYQIFWSILNDNDAIGKIANNSRMEMQENEPYRFFHFDKCFVLKPYNFQKMSLRKDFYLSTPGFEQRMDPQRKSYVDYEKEGGLRNYSILEGQFTEKFLSLLNFQSKYEDTIELFDCFEERLKYLASSSSNQDIQDILQWFLIDLQSAKDVLQQRSAELERTFSLTMSLYEKSGHDLNLVDAVNALEEYLSPSTMYSRQGIPCRTIHAVNPHTRILFEVTGYNKDYLTLIINHPSKKLPSNLFESLGGSNYRISVENLKLFDSKRNQRILHPQSLPFSAFLEAKEAIPKDYLLSKHALIKMEAAYCKSDSIFIENYNYEYEKYQTLSQIALDEAKYQEEKISSHRLVTLEKMYQMVNHKLEVLNNSPPLLLKRGLGFYTELKARIAKQQQLELKNLLVNNKDFISGLKQEGEPEQILCNFFSQIHRLDLNHEVNQLLITALNTKQLLNTDLLEILITLASGFKDNDYYQLRDKMAIMQEIIINLEKSLTPKVTVTRCSIFKPTNLPSSNSSQVSIESRPS